MEITEEIIKENEGILNSVVANVYNKYRRICKHNGVDKRELKYTLITVLYLALRDKDDYPPEPYFYKMLQYGLIDYIRCYYSRSKIPPIWINDDIDTLTKYLVNKNSDSMLWLDIEFIKKYCAHNNTEEKVFELVILGYRKEEVAKILGVSYSTVYFSVRNVRERYIKGEKRTFIPRHRNGDIPGKVIKK